MKIIIFGASSETSIGSMIGNKLVTEGNSVILASRSGTMGVASDISNSRQVTKLVRREKPDCIIHAAGVFMRMNKLGALTDWKGIEKNIKAKSIGALTILNAAARHAPQATIIFCGGSKVSREPNFAAFTLGNGALWSVTQFATQHTQLRVYYLELPTVWPSAMLKKYLQTKSNVETSRIKSISVAPDLIFRSVKKILAGEHPSGSRICVGKKAYKI